MYRLLILLLLSLPLLCACGKKSPVRPLEKPVPQAPRELSLEQKGDDFILAWKRPAANRDGSALDESMVFLVSRMDYDPAEACPECRDLSRLIARIDSEYPRQVRVEGDRYFLRDTGLEPDRGYRYRIEAVGKEGVPGDSARVEARFHIPPSPPLMLTAKSLDRQVRLSWEAPAQLPEGARIAGYNLYRRLKQSAFALRPLNGAVLESTTYDDFAVENETIYHYELRALYHLGDELVESPPSESAAARPSSPSQ